MNLMKNERQKDRQITTDEEKGVIENRKEFIQSLDIVQYIYQLSKKTSTTGPRNHSFCEQPLYVLALQVVANTQSGC